MLPESIDQQVQDCMRQVASAKASLVFDIESARSRLEDAKALLQEVRRLVSKVRTPPAR